MLVRARELKSNMSQDLIERIASLHNIDVQFNTQITSLHDAENLESAEILRGGQCMVLPTEHVFLFIGASPNTAWLSECGVLVERNGFSPGKRRRRMRANTRPAHRAFSAPVTFDSDRPNV